MKVLVTGGAGFIGHHLVRRLLAQGHEVTVADDLSAGSRGNIPHTARFRKVSVCTSAFRELVCMIQPEVVIHMAAQSSVPRSVANPVLDAQVNVVGTVNVLESCAAAGVRKVIFSHTSAVYAEATEGPVSEESPLAPQSPYGVAKHCAIQYLKLYSETRGLACTALCYANVYGPGQRATSDGGVVAAFLDSVVQNRRPTIFGDGLQTRDFVFVDDVVEANLRAINRAAGQVVNVGTGRQCSILELWAAIAHVTGTTLAPIYEPSRPGDVRHQYMKVDRAYRELAWEPSVSLIEGLSVTYSHLRDEVVSTWGDRNESAGDRTAHG